MDIEFRKRVIDYFSPTDLIEVLDFKIEELVELLHDHVDEKKGELDEYLKHGK